jgi:hypothetical protein
MSDGDRLARITQLRVEADRLRSALQRATMKTLVERAMRDLDDAEAWIRRQSELHLESRLAMADISLDLASARIDFLRDALAAYGPAVDLNE